MLISIPLTLNYLGVERFGVWMTLTSFTTLAAFMDFGLGKGPHPGVGCPRELADDVVAAARRRPATERNSWIMRVLISRTLSVCGSP
jgi:hypothetical protein